MGIRGPAGRLTARARILGWMLLLVAAALVASVLITERILHARTESRLQAELIHEGDKLRATATRGLDPATGAPFSAVDQVLAAHLTGNLPEPGEMYFSVVDGHAHQRSRQDLPVRLDLDPAVVQRAATAVVPVQGSAAGPGYDLRYAIYPVELAGSSQRGALVVVEDAGQAHQANAVVLRTMVIAGSVALLAAGVAGWLVAGRVLAPIRLVRRTAEQIGESDLSGRIAVVGSDDVAQLARTVNGMLDRLEAAFDQQRRFLGDAGHELRTPLTVVRGHLELMGDDPAEQRETLTLVLGELDRMGRIVDDLTVLAQADRPDFLRPGPVDLAVLVFEVAAKARALGDRRWTVAGAAEVTVVADEQRLTQALMQLCANAVAHTRDGDPIEVGSAADDRQVRLWVKDHGAGIPADEQDRIFDRFIRGSTAPAGSGSGLGLAIVRSITTAHHGRVRLTSAPGRGATFTLELDRPHGGSR